MEIYETHCCGVEGGPDHLSAESGVGGVLKTHPPTATVGSIYEVPAQGGLKAAKSNGYNNLYYGLHDFILGPQFVASGDPLPPVKTFQSSEPEPQP